MTAAPIGFHDPVHPLTGGLAVHCVIRPRKCCIHGPGFVEARSDGPELVFSRGDGRHWQQSQYQQKLGERVM
ncbi:MAG: hypothetical protein ISP98_06505 [Luminiphilus sp.]|nr:hypothetical protein [Luminiphilus sp.]